MSTLWKKDQSSGRYYCVTDLTVLDDVDTVYLSGVHSHDRNIIAKNCLMLGIKTFFNPKSRGDGHRRIKVHTYDLSSHAYS